MNFHDFAAACGLLVRDIVPDGKIRRCATTDHPATKNGAYMFAGTWGFAQNWATHADPQLWHDDSSRPDDYDATAFQAAAKRRAQDLRAQQERVAKQAETLLRNCELTAHAYLDRKGFPEELGMVDDRGCLVIPIRDCQTNRVLSVQRVSVDGEKRFLLGGRTKGGIYSMGSARAPEAWLCEGYATGLSIREAIKTMRLNGRVVVCFSASNLAHVAGLLGGRRWIVADNDRSGTGAEFAGKTGLTWVMPAETGTDANDLHQTAGVYAVATLMQEAMQRGQGVP